MFLKIVDTMMVEELQDRFSQCFPFLKIEFYSKPHKRFEPTDNRFVIPGKERISSIRKNHTNGVMEIKSWHSVAKVEKEMKDRFGLNIQIFRTSPDGTWVQTADSDELTLQDQNELANRLLSRE